ncbi:MAG: hypothetical protein RLN62_03015 [Rickettsiales bacterium]
MSDAGAAKDERSLKVRATEFISELKTFSDKVEKINALSDDREAQDEFEKQKESLVKSFEESGHDFPTPVKATVRNLSLGNYEYGINEMAVPLLQDAAGLEKHSESKKGIFSGVKGLLGKMGIKSGGTSVKRPRSKSEGHKRGL